MASHLLEEQPWISGHYQCQDAETAHFERLSGVCSSPSKGGCRGAQNCTQNTSSLVTEIKKAREQIQKSLQTGSAGSVDSAVVARVDQLEKENKDLKKVTQDLMSMIKKLEGRVCALEKSGGNTPNEKADEPKPVEDEDEDDDDDDFDMFGDDDIDEAAEKLKEERLKQYAEKKAKKPQVIAKSSVVLDVKPWDDETDMKKLEECVRKVEMDGLVWGASKLVPVGYGIKKLQIVCVVEDDKVSTEELQETIEGFEDFIQSTDIAAFQKI